MLALDQKYKPATIGGFAGLGHAKALLGTLRDNPWPSSWLLTGDSGIGKTSMAFALGREMKAEIHHIESRACNVATVQEVISRCHYMPFGGGWHLIICDEADRMTDAAQVNWLSILDGTQMPPQTVVMFTSNSTARLESRFLSRCRVINFSARKNIADSAVFLRTIWELESTAPPPDFTALLERHGGNVRSSLNDLEMELVSPGFLDLPEKISSEPTQRCETTEKSELRKSALKLHSGGISLSSIAQQIGVPQSTVWRWTHVAARS